MLWAPAAISAIGNLAGSIIGQGASDDAAKFARQQFKFQQRAAKRGITWRVKDAINAGIHPIYALGAQTFNPSPISISGDSPMAQGVAAMGQDIGRAVDAGLSRPQQVLQQATQMASLDLMRAQTEHIKGQTDAIRAQTRSAITGQGDAPLETLFKGVAPREAQAAKVTRTPWRMFGVDFEPSQQASDAQALEDRGGEMSGDLLGPLIILQDLAKKAGELPGIGQYYLNRLMR